MKAVCWHGTHDVRVESVPEPKILNGRDALVKITLTAICGSDLHLYDGYIPTMKKGDILGHEFMGEVLEVGKDVPNLKKGDRVVVPFTICCGRCFYCQRPLGVGFFFSLGHSTIVFLLGLLVVVGIRGLSGAVENDSSTLAASLMSK